MVQICRDGSGCFLDGLLFGSLALVLVEMASIVHLAAVQLAWSSDTEMAMTSTSSLDEEADDITDDDVSFVTCPDGYYGSCKYHFQFIFVC